MAKRDKLYTVNRWNKSIFEEELRRKRLYGWGGIGVRIDRGNEVNSYGKTVWDEQPAINTNQKIRENILDYNTYANPSWLQDITKIWAAPTDIQGTSESNDNKETSNTQKPKLSSTLDWVNDISTGALTTVNTPDYIKGVKQLFEKIGSSTVKSTTKSIPTFTSSAGISLADSLKPSASQYIAKTVSPEMETAVKASSQKLADNLMSSASKSGISSAGKVGANLGAAVGSELGYNSISDGLNTTPGSLIKTLGSAAGTVVLFIPGVGWAAGPAITLASGILGGLYNRAFGSETYDNGATAYTNRLNTMNPNGSNEYIANLLASTGIGPQATWKTGWLNHSGKDKALAINDAQDLALRRFRRGAKDAINTNNWLQLQYALNDNITAMGGKLRKCKCNKKAYGGYLDSATPTGFNFLSDFANAQMIKNLANQDNTISLGNSFMDIDNSGIFAGGGKIHIKPSHRGRLTKLKKRTGKTEAELYNDGNPAHRKMVVFALNSRRWRKHALGGYLKGKVYDIPEEEVQRLIRAGYEVEYL